MSYQPFYELSAWKRTRSFKLKIYPILKRFPPDEKYELTSQLRRAVRSIGANISEGHGRKTAKDELHFCIIARGSLSESLHHLIDAFDCGYIGKDELLFLKQEWDNLRRTLVGYITFLKSKLQPPLNSSAEGTLSEDETTYNTTETSDDSLEAFFAALND